MTLTETLLKQSPLYEAYIDASEVVLIHNIYRNGPSRYAAFIVITQDATGYDITRFFVAGGKIHVSVDYECLEAKEVFDLLVERYS